MIEADHSGRPPLASGIPERAGILGALCEEVEGEVKPLVLGRHLIAFGMKPGHHFGDILKQAFEAQLDGLFHSPEEGVKLLREGGVI